MICASESRVLLIHHATHSLDQEEIRPKFITGQASFGVHLRKKQGACLRIHGLVRDKMQAVVI